MCGISRCLLLASEYWKIVFGRGRNRAIRSRWGKRGCYKRNNVYNASVRRNSEFVSLSAIIFWNLHTNRCRARCTRKGKRVRPGIVSDTRRAVVLKSEAFLPTSPGSYRQLSTTLKFYLALFRGGEMFLEVVRVFFRQWQHPSLVFCPLPDFYVDRIK